MVQRVGRRRHGGRSCRRGREKLIRCLVAWSAVALELYGLGAQDALMWSDGFVEEGD